MGNEIPNTRKGNTMMTRKEMITACVEDQINRGIIKAESKEKQIKARLSGAIKMSWNDCKEWFDSVFTESDPRGYAIADAETGNVILEAKFATI